MTRKKLNLAYITNDSMRKATFNKRKKGIVKKIHELSVLCGIEACAVIYNPFNSNPEVWPSNSGVKNVVHKFEMLAEVEQEKKMVNHEIFLRQTISKTMENNNKKMKDNAEMAMKEAMFHLLGRKGDNIMLSDRNREDLCKYIDQYLKELYHHRNVTLNQSRLEYGESSSAANVLEPRAIIEVGSSSFSNIDAFNSSQLEKRLSGFRPIISSNQRPEQVQTCGSNFLSTTADQPDYYPMMNPINVNDQFSNLNVDHSKYQQQFGYSTVGQDGIYNATQNNNMQEEWFVDQMINHPQEKGFSLMDNNNHYYQQQP